MVVIIHDLDEKFDEFFRGKYDYVIHANGQYAPCQGCFKCWTKTPAACYMKDSLQTVCRIVGQADELIICTENCYGAYSPAVKNIFDRCNGVSTPLSTIRHKQMHHGLRYGKKSIIRVFAYEDITDEEKATFELMVKRNSYNYGYQTSEFTYIETLGKLKEALV